jgi:hypothetical protein
MKTAHRPKRQNVEEISIFQTRIPRPVGARVPLFLLMINFVCALFLAILMAEGSENPVLLLKDRCPRGR